MGRTVPTQQRSLTSSPKVNAKAGFPPLCATSVDDRSKTVLEGPASEDTEDEDDENCPLVASGDFEGPLRPGFALRIVQCLGTTSRVFFPLVFCPECTILK
jgi:hypothetical protein